MNIPILQVISKVKQGLRPTTFKNDLYAECYESCKKYYEELDMLFQEEISSNMNYFTEITDKHLFEIRLLIEKYGHKAVSEALEYVEQFFCD